MWSDLKGSNCHQLQLQVMKINTAYWAVVSARLSSKKKTNPKTLCHRSSIFFKEWPYGLKKERVLFQILRQSRCHQAHGCPLEAGQMAQDLSVGWGFGAVLPCKHSQGQLSSALALQQLSKPGAVSSTSWEAYVPDLQQCWEEQQVAASRMGNILVAGLESYLAKRQALTSSIDLDHWHAEPSVLQNPEDFYSSLECIFTNHTSIFPILKIWYDITRETFCIHQSQMRLAIIYGHIFPERLSHKQSENIC